MEVKKIRSQKGEIAQWKKRKEKLMKKAYNYMVWLSKEQKNLRIKILTLKNRYVRNL